MIDTYGDLLTNGTDKDGYDVASMVPSGESYGHEVQYLRNLINQTDQLYLIGDRGHHGSAALPT